MTTRPPDPGSKLIDRSGAIDQTWLRWTRAIWRQIASLAESVATLSTGKAAVTQAVTWPILIEAPANQAYTYPKAGWTGKVTEVITQTSSGTCTVTVSIAEANLTGGSNSASTTEDSTGHDDEIAADDTVAITVSNNSSAADLAVIIRGTRTLEA